VRVGFCTDENRQSVAFAGAKKRGRNLLRMGAGEDKPFRKNKIVYCTSQNERCNCFEYCAILLLIFEEKIRKIEL
jgi:hypothetical protein